MFVILLYKLYLGRRFDVLTELDQVVEESDFLCLTETGGSHFVNFRCGIRLQTLSESYLPHFQLEVLYQGFLINWVDYFGVFGALTATLLFSVVDLLRVFLNEAR